MKKGIDHFRYLRVDEPVTAFRGFIYKEKLNSL